MTGPDAFRRTIAAQKSAADPRASVWVAANAGSGKTRVLTDRVTRLLLDGAEPARILCLTFTKAAAAEMAGRLFARLGAWSLMDDAALGDQVAAIAGEAATADPERLAAARRLFAKALDTPGGLKIQTIHGFCEGLLRRFPIEAGLSARFHVLDESDAAAMRDRALDAAILSADIPALFRETLALALDERTLREQIAGVLERRGGFVEALAKGKVAGLIADLEETFGVSMQDTEDAVCAAFFRAAPLASFEPILAALRQSGVQDAERADQAAPALFAENDVDAFAALRPLYVTKEGAPRKKIASAKLRKAAPQAADRLEAAAESYLAATERLAAIGAFRHSAALNAFAAATLEAYETEKRAAGALDYEDLILSTRRLFADPEAAAWALYKLDGGLDHILVDEAQDTSPEQWEVVLSPLREFFAGEGAERPPTDAAGRPPMPRTVFAVGDEKQSIYSFQGADVAKFSQMQGVLTAMTTSAGADWRVEDLSLSFRSAPPVLAFVDAVFGDPAAAHGVVSNMGAEGGDAPLRHSAFRDGAGGRVEFWPAAEPEPQTDARAWDAPVDQEDDANPKRVLAARIADTIAGWLRGGEELESAGRPIRPDDILILVRARGAFFQHMVRALKARDLPVAGADRIKLMEEISVLDLLALARFAISPDDDLALAEVLKSPLVGLSEEALYDLAQPRRGRLWEAAIAEESGLAPADIALLKGAVRRARQAGPFAFFSEALEALRDERSGRQRMLRRLGPAAADAMDELLNQCLQYERDRPPSLAGFVGWAMAQETELKRDLEAASSEIRVMTVHGAKGLEANVVFLADTCKLPRADRSALYRTGGGAAFCGAPGEAAPARVEEEKARAKEDRLSEYRRLFYVAATRARDRLYVTGYKHLVGRSDIPKADKGSWYELSVNAFEAMDGVAPIDLPWGDRGLRVAAPQTAPPDVAAVEAARADEPPPAWLFEAVGPRGERSNRADEARRPSANAAKPAGLAHSVRRKAAIARGETIHALLQILAGLPRASWTGAAGPALAALPEDERAGALAEATAVLEAPDWSRLFGPGSHGEVPLVRTAGTGPGGAGARLLMGRPDRIVVTPSLVEIVDFKSDRPAPEPGAPPPAAYLRQLAGYRAAIADLYPGRTIACALLWTAAPRLDAIADAFLDAAGA